MAGRPQTIESWLESLNMAEYVNLFRKYGGVEDLTFATEAEIKDLGISNIAHRVKIASSLRVLKDTFENGHVNNSGLFSPRQRICGTSQVPNSPTSSYPDFQHMIVSPEKLQTDLQREFSGDPAELRSRSWYHGSITRVAAESLVANNGDFLIRDCISKPGDFVLTCKWNDTPLNFIINSIVGYRNPRALPVISYQFEEEQFPTIQQLIKHYQDQSKPVTTASEAVLQNPVARSVPLCYYDSKYRASSCNVTPTHSPQSSPFVTPSTSPRSSPNMNRRLITPLDNQSSHSKRSCEDANNNNNTNNNGGFQKHVRPPSIDNLPVINVTPPGGNVSYLQSHQVQQKADRSAPTCIRVNSAPELSNGYGRSRQPELEQNGLHGDSSESEFTNNPPPKPSRIPSVKYKLNSATDFKDGISESDSNTETGLKYVGPETFYTFDDDHQKRISPTSTRNQSENNNCLDYKKIYNKFIHRTEVEHNEVPTSPSSSPNLQKHRKSQSPRTSPFFSSETNNTSRERTYQLVARSRSFQQPATQLTKCTQTESKTLPNTFSKIRFGKLRLPCTSEQDNQDKHNHKEIVEQAFTGVPDSVSSNCRCMARPHVFQSYIVPETFTSGLLPKDHKLLDQSVLLNVKTILLNKSPEDTALHLTKYDLELTFAVSAKDFGLGVTSGLELLTLPQGNILRQDVIERWESLRMFTQATLLTSQTVGERARLFRFWILTCHELKKTAGNYFSFAAIMAALTSPQISRLTDTWTTLRQTHTASAVVFDTKLRPEFTSLNDATSNLPLKNVCVPYITPVCYLLERDAESTLQDYFWEDGLDPIASAIDVLLNHLDLARVIASQVTRYRVTGKAILATVNFDPELSQILSPEFHILLLWGNKGRNVNRQDRLNKLGQIFTLLSHKCQTPEDCDTEV
ncbi:unnamed protein product [Candidula unifasciata]|uniref:Breast cancer anti-estrogen resistance protein 3 n=1 Tax=Candidula unifasciata TaxID=100452 RepID=A0A8S4A8K3_9EUPU|nr:unnamed protein product [Candidula unifasciata]